MEKKPEVKKLSKVKMFFKITKLFLFRIVKRKWYVPAVSEMTVDQLNDRIHSKQSPIIIDTRDKKEFNGAEGSYRKYGHISHAQCIPIMELSASLDDLAKYKDKEIVTICPGGGMSLIAAEMMDKAGFPNVKSLTGGMDLWHKKGYPTIAPDVSTYPQEDIKSKAMKDKGQVIEEKTLVEDKALIEVHKTLDARNLTCPLPILKSRKALKALKISQVLEILTTDPASKNDIPAWIHVSGQELISVEENDSREYRFLVRRLKSPLMDKN